MGFFDSLRRAEPPAPPPRRQPPEWVHPGWHVLPAALPVDRVLIRRPELAGFVSALWVQPSGFEFEATVLRRPTDGQRIHAVQDSPFADWVPRGRPQFTAVDEGRMLFGVRYADGRSATADSAAPGPFEADRPQPPVIRQVGGRGMPGRWRARYWVWGLPESGDIDLLYSWRAQGVPETAFTLDGGAVRAAARRAVVLWDEPGDQDGGGSGASKHGS